MSKDRRWRPVVSRRTFIRGAAGAAFVGAAPHVVLAQTPETLVVNTQGGEYQEIVEATVLKPFEKKFGVRVVHDPTGSASQDYAKIRAARGAPGFDVAGLLTPPEMILGAREKLLEPVTEREVPNLRHCWSVAARVIPSVGVAHTLQYAATDLQQGQGRAAALVGRLLGAGQALRRSHPRPRHQLQSGQPALRLRADPRRPTRRRRRRQHGAGLGAVARAEAVRRRRGDRHRPRRCRISRTARCGSRRTGARAPATTSRAACPFDMVVPEEGVIGLFDCAAVPVGAKNKKLAYEFLNFRLEPEVQRAFSLAYFCSPGRGDIADWPAEFAALPDHHRGADRQGAVPRFRGHRAAPARLDAALAGDHGLAERPMARSCRLSRRGDACVAPTGRIAAPGTR